LFIGLKQTAHNYQRKTFHFQERNFQQRLLLSKQMYLRKYSAVNCSY